LAQHAAVARLYTIAVSSPTLVFEGSERFLFLKQYAFAEELRSHRDNLMTLTALLPTLLT
jgi:hypothetical protein